MTNELQRLHEIYTLYQSDPAVQARWDSANPGNQCILQERQATAKWLLTRYGFAPLTHRRVLDIGCGSGSVLASLRDLGAEPGNLHGVDLMPDRIELARTIHPDLQFECRNAEHLEYPENHFDLVLLFTVLSSILDERVAANVASEARRVLKPNGAVLWYDLRYHNPWNPHTRAMTRTQIQALFPGFRFHLHATTLLPQLARRLNRAAPILYPLLSAIPVLRTHYLGILVKPPVSHFSQHHGQAEGKYHRRDGAHA